jgi:hypothetical protein
LLLDTSKLVCSAAVLLLWRRGRPILWEIAIFSQPQRRGQIIPRELHRAIRTPAMAPIQKRNAIVKKIIRIALGEAGKPEGRSVGEGR